MQPMKAGPPNRLAGSPSCIYVRQVLSPAYGVFALVPQAESRSVGGVILRNSSKHLASALPTVVHSTAAEPEGKR